MTTHADMPERRHGERRLAEWLDWGRRYRRWRDSTIDGYRRRVVGWLDWCDDNAVRPTRATTEQIRAYLDTLHRSASVHTQTRSALIAYYDWQVQHRQSMRHNPARGIERIPSRESIPRAMEPADARRVLDVAHGYGPKWYCYMAMLLYGGLRRFEACQARWTDIEGRDEWLRVTGKGGQQRVVPMHRELRRAIVALRSTSPSPEWLFPGTRGRGCMSTATGTKWTRRILDDAGLTDVTGHACRHTAGTTALVAGADIAAVAELLGHRDLKSTYRYVRARPVRVASAVDALDYGPTP